MLDANMTSHDEQAEGAARGPAKTHDAIVIGAGIAGIYAVHRFREEGLDVIALEAANNVGGVWHHNRYPGARVDVESTQYCYLFSKEIYEEWQWSERYATQPELLRYFNFVVDRLGLRDLIRLETRVTAARWLADERLWEVRTNRGEILRTRFLVTAMGNLSAPQVPDFPGFADYKGEWVQTSCWPEREVKFAGRKVGVFGTGSSGVQCIPVVARQAEHLTVFQRSPNFSVPAQNRPLGPDDIARVASRLGAFRDLLMTQGGATWFPEPRGRAIEFTPEECEAILEEFWQFGGHAYPRAFENSFTDDDSNKVLSDFVRRKIAETVDDPDLAEKLTPRDMGIGTRRVCVDTEYYQTFNRDNVSLVDLREAPLVRFTETGVETADGRHHELDLVIFALGFRAFTGALIDADIRNAAGNAVTDHWAPGWKTLLGYMTTGFPNLLMVSGPGGITLSANVPISSEFQVDWLARLIRYMDEHGHATVEPREEAQAAWVDRAHTLSKAHLAMRTDVSNWWIQRDPATGERVCMTWLGGFPAFVEECARVEQEGYEAFKFA